LACSSQTDESESKPGHAPQGIFAPDTPPATTRFPGSRTDSEYAGLHPAGTAWFIGSLEFV